jgi:hypothetical protein
MSRVACKVCEAESYIDAKTMLACWTCFQSAIDRAMSFATIVSEGYAPTVTERQAAIEYLKDPLLLSNGRRN